MTDCCPNLPEGLDVHLFCELFWDVIAEVNVFNILSLENIVVKRLHCLDLIYYVRVFGVVRNPCFKHRNSQVRYV